MLTAWMARVSIGNGCAGPIAISWNSSALVVGRQTSIAAEASATPPRDVQEVIVQELPTGAGGTTYDGDATFDVDCTTTQLLQGPRLVEDVAGAPIVIVSAETGEA